MERKEINDSHGSQPIQIEMSDIGGMMKQAHPALQRTDYIAYTRELAENLHSAIDDMLNPWRPISELPKIGGAYWVIEKWSNKPLYTMYSTTNCRFYYEESFLMNITHWKPVLLPTPPKDI